MIKRYGILGIISLFISYLRTKILFPNARLIRYPFEIRNKHLVKVGYGFTTGKYCRIEAYNEGDIRLRIGKNFQMNDSVHIVASEFVEIGENVLIASKVFISDTSHGEYNLSNVQSSPLIPPTERPLITKKVIIKDNVWIGEFVSIMPGVTIGEGAIIGTMSVVTKDVPPNTISFGSPSKVVKEYNFDLKKWIKVKK